ncbi:hypothetical protein GCM10011614_08740 [Novosphingobium colocasiae]|uniref:Uncharacterized protein n=1 Tax=Novosphingobium colocasiae TaxID=1256513 RepID=A0A918PB87_9SPHN|nr:hypothetical protein GCM10011614_08740 [Novosphingobium colocasiae]
MGVRTAWLVCAPGLVWWANANAQTDLQTQVRLLVGRVEDAVNKHDALALRALGGDFLREGNPVSAEEMISELRSCTLSKRADHSDHGFEWLGYECPGRKRPNVCENGELDLLVDTSFGQRIHLFEGRKNVPECEVSPPPKIKVVQ